MKTNLLICAVLLTICNNSFAYDSVSLRTIAKIESNNNSKAFNSRTQATGIYQITPICLKDYNLFAKAGQYTLKDMFDDYKAKNVATWYIEKRLPQLLKAKGYDVTVRNVLIGYNCGTSCINKPLPDETINYLKKYDAND